MFVVSKSTSKAATDCRGRGSSQCLLLVNPHQKQLQTGGGRGSSQCLLLVNPHQTQAQTVGGGGAPSVCC